MNVAELTSNAAMTSKTKAVSNIGLEACWTREAWRTGCRAGGLHPTLRRSAGTPIPEDRGSDLAACSVAGGRHFVSHCLKWGTTAPVFESFPPRLFAGVLSRSVLEFDGAVAGR